MNKNTVPPATVNNTEQQPLPTRTRTAAIRAPNAVTAAKTAKAKLGEQTDSVVEPEHSKPRNASDYARDELLRHDLEDESARSAADRHRERLTAVEAEEDDVHGEDDDPQKETQQREQGISEQEADDADDERA